MTPLAVKLLARVERDGALTITYGREGSRSRDALQELLDAGLILNGSRQTEHDFETKTMTVTWTVFAKWRLENEDPGNSRP